jgi:hypothetical protein
MNVEEAVVTVSYNTEVFSRLNNYQLKVQLH